MVLAHAAGGHVAGFGVDGMLLEPCQRCADAHPWAAQCLWRLGHGEHLHHMALIILFLLWASLAWAQPTVSTACSGTTNDGGTVSFSCTTGSPNPFVGIGVSFRPKTDTITTISYGASTPTQAIAIEHSVEDSELRLYGQAAPASGSQTVTVTTAGGSDITVGVLEMAGAHQSAPLGTAVSAQAIGGSSYTVNATSAATERVIGFAVCFSTSGQTFTEGAGQTEHLDTTNNDTGQAFHATSEVGAATTTISGTYGIAVDGCLVTAVPVKPAAAAVSTRRVSPLVMP